ncbi:hypothetical protein SLS57_011896 [Botryosphaeria dothidea]
MLKTYNELRTYAVAEMAKMDEMVEKSEKKSPRDSSPPPSSSPTIVINYHITPVSSTSAAATSPPPPSRKRKPTLTSEPPEKKKKKKKTSASDEWYPARAILNETETHYLIEWVGNNPATGKPWAPSWEPRSNASDELVSDWVKPNDDTSTEDDKSSDQDTFK